MDQYQREQLEAAAKAAEMDETEKAQLMNESDPSYRFMFKVFYPDLNWDACVVCTALLPISDSPKEGSVIYIEMNNSRTAFCYEHIPGVVLKGTISTEDLQ